MANFRRMLPEDAGTAEAKGEFVLTPEQISLNTEALGTTWEAVVVPETPYDESMPPGPVGMPTHIQILFGGTTDPNDVTPSDPMMYIIPPLVVASCSCATPMHPLPRRRKALPSPAW